MIAQSSTVPSEKRPTMSVLYRKLYHVRLSSYGQVTDISIMDSTVLWEPSCPMFHITCIAQVTDIMNSTALWEALTQDTMASALHVHHTLVRNLLRVHCGYEQATEGDSFLLAVSSTSVHIYRATCHNIERRRLIPAGSEVCLQCWALVPLVVALTSLAPK